MAKTTKLWGGRFDKTTDELVEGFSASIHFDKRLYRQDITGSIAHCRMLAKQGIIEVSECLQIVAGLEAILLEIETGIFEFKVEYEDIHMNIEAALRERIGPVAGKLHTARSRNDQVALDMRMYVKEAIEVTVARLRTFQTTMLRLAERYVDVVMPGYTHLQRAQPVLLAHHLLAYFEMLQRDIQRFHDCYRRTDVMPLGSGALAGVTVPIDRAYLASELGFAAISRNSMDAVADRDFVVEFISASSIAMMHLSRLAEEVVLWSSAEFNFVELDDAYSTGSSIMPQKKNPDVAELVRGKTGRVYGHLIAILSTLKNLPLAYNKDMQEDKEGLFDTIDTLQVSLEVFCGMLSTMKVNRVLMESVAAGSYVLATDVADYLARKGVPFREAHAIVGRLVRLGIDQGKQLSELSMSDYKKSSPLFGEDIFEITIHSSVAARDVPGGTAPKQVRAALKEATRIVSEGL
ncbi:MAG: argininosuccinate lyase [Dehalococcoidia bacterium]|nr:argininosuccinate lyase [Dehalococcoidia bacterium]